MKYGLSSETIEKMNQVFSNHTKISKVMLYGSRAKGNFREGSDIDLTLFGEDIDIKELHTIELEIDDLLLPYKVDLSIYDRLKNEALREHIQRVGVVFYEKGMGEWREVRLGDMATFTQGIQVPLNNQKHEKFDGSVRFIRIVDFTQGDKNDIRYIVNSGNKYIIKSDDLVMIRYGSQTAGKIARGLNGAIANNTFKVSPKENILNKKFLFYYLSQASSTMPAVTFGMIGDLKFKNPPLKEQKAIAEVLSSLDDKIDLLYHQNKTLEELAQTLFRQWFIEEAKNDWEEVTVGDLVKTNVSTLKKDTNLQAIQYLDTSSLTEGKIDTFQQLDLADAPSRAKRIVQHNDVLISTVRPNQKHYGIIKNPTEDIIVSTGYCVISCEKINPHFIYILLTTDDMTEYLHSIAEGSTTTYPSLKPSDIEAVEFLLPPKGKLKEFSDYADNAWNKIDKNHIQIKTLENMRDTLLPKLMSGEVRVKNG